MQVKGLELSLPYNEGSVVVSHPIFMNLLDVSETVDL